MPHGHTWVLAACLWPAAAWARPVVLELGGMLDTAPDLSSGGALLSGGAALRLAVMARHVGATAGIAGLSPSDQTFASGQSHFTRMPIDIGFRAGLHRCRFSLSGD